MSVVHLTTFKSNVSFASLRAAVGPVIAACEAQSGFVAGYFGQQIENLTTFTLAVHWMTLDAARSFEPHWEVALHALVRVTPFELVNKFHVELDNDPSEALQAPCTEVFTAYGVGDTFLPNCRRFAAIMESAQFEGFYDYSCGATSDPIEVPEEETREPGVVLLIGWRSKEAHEAAKGTDSQLSANIDLIRQDRKTTTLWHIKFVQISI